MPIWDFKCDKCALTIEKYQYGDSCPECECGEVMRRVPSFPVMVKMKGEGGYPSRRKFVKGTAPYVSNTKAWLDTDPYESTRKAQHWDSE